MALDFGSGYMPGLKDAYSSLEKDKLERQQAREEFKIKQEEFKAKRTEKFTNEINDLFYDNSIMKSKLTPNAEGNLIWTGTDSTLPSRELAYKNYKLYAKRYGQQVDVNTFDQLYNGMVTKYYGDFQKHIKALSDSGYDMDDVRFATKNNPKFKAQLDALVDAGFSDVGVYGSHKTPYEKFMKAWTDNPGKAAVAGTAVLGAGAYAGGAAFTSEGLLEAANERFKSIKDVEGWEDKVKAIKKKNPKRYTGKGSAKNIASYKSRLLKDAKSKWMDANKDMSRMGKWTKNIAGLKGPQGRFIAGTAPFLAPTVGQFVGGQFGREGEMVGQGLGSGVQAAMGAKTFWQYMKNKIPGIAARAATKGGAIAMLDSPAPGIMDLVGALAMMGFGAADAYNLWQEWNNLQKGK